MELTSRLAVTAGATRLTTNLQGRGIQPTDDPSHGVLYMRWVHDDRGNAWGDNDGETKQYTVFDAVTGSQAPGKDTTVVAKGT